jgi:prepilin-type N-terminal cleavage/methylation domain-containing protein
MTEIRTRRPNILATSAATMIGRRQRPFRTRERAYSLVEMMVALIVVGVLISMGIPRFQQSLEQARANVAGANLQAIWSAQRLYWLQNRGYAIDVNAPLDTLLAANPIYPLIDKTLTTTTGPYTYSVTSIDNGVTFTATALRTGSSNWSGSWTIDQNGQPGESDGILQGGHLNGNIKLGFQ